MWVLVPATPSGLWIVSITSVVALGPGKSRNVARQIASLPGVKMADACCGSRDVFAVVEVAESQELNKLRKTEPILLAIPSLPSEPRKETRMDGETHAHFT